MSLLAVGLIVLGFLGTAIEFKAIHAYETAQGKVASEQTLFWPRLYENLIGWLVSDGQTYAGEFLNPWLDNSAIFSVGLLLGLLLGFCARAGKVVCVVVPHIAKKKPK